MLGLEAVLHGLVLVALLYLKWENMDTYGMSAFQLAAEIEKSSVITKLRVYLSTLKKSHFEFQKPSLSK